MFERYLELIPDQLSRETALIICLMLFKPALLLGVVFGHYIMYPVGKAVYR